MWVEGVPHLETNPNPRNVWNCILISVALALDKSRNSGIILQEYDQVR